MKTKTKHLALLEIVIVLCAVFLVAIPAIAADQTTQKVSASAIATTASEDDDRFALEIFGNANEDDTIDMRDTTYIKLVIFGKKPRTDFADANYDGKISMLDVGQTKLIILGKEKKLTITDSADKIVTVNKPVERIILLYHATGSAIRSVGAEDKVVGVCSWFESRQTFFPKLSKLPSVGHCRNPDYEKILELEPDIAFSDLGVPMGSGPLDEKLEELGIPFARIDLYTPGKLSEEIEKLGYIFDKRNEAGEFADWYNGIMYKIKERVEGLSEKEKPRSYGVTNYAPDPPYGITCKGYMEMTEFAGSINIAIDLPGEPSSISVDPEWVIKQNPSYILSRLGSGLGATGYDVDDESGVKAVKESIMRRPGWENIDAVKNGKVYLTTIEIMIGGHFIAIANMAKCFHPELFEDIDPQAIHQEYLTRFQHLDYNVYEHGVFWYPPLEEG